MPRPPAAPPASFPGWCWSRPVAGSFGNAAAAERLDYLDDRRAQDDDEQGREDAADEREQHLDRGLGGLLFGSRASLDAELLGLDLQNLGDRNAELLGLDDRADEVRQRLDVGSGNHVAEGVAA